MIKNKYLLLSPHSDDESLFCSYIIQRFKPLVLIITDGTKHEVKFGKSSGIIVRRGESEAAIKILGAKIDFLGIPDNGLYLDNLIVNLEDYRSDGKVFAPALQGGNPDHDVVSQAATKVWGNKVVYYSTYALKNLKPYGELAIIPNTHEVELKNEALKCYKSQLKINPHHFEAVFNQPEFINFTQIP